MNQPLPLPIVHTPARQLAQAIRERRVRAVDVVDAGCVAQRREARQVAGGAPAGRACGRDDSVRKSLPSGP